MKLKLFSCVSFYLASSVFLRFGVLPFGDFVDAPVDVVMMHLTLQDSAHSSVLHSSGPQHQGMSCLMKKQSRFKDYVYSGSDIAKNIFTKLNTCSQFKEHPQNRNVIKIYQYKYSCYYFFRKICHDRDKLILKRKKFEQSIFHFLFSLKYFM